MAKGLSTSDLICLVKMPNVETTNLPPFALEEQAEVAIAAPATIKLAAIKHTFLIFIIDLSENHTCLINEGKFFFDNYWFIILFH